MYKIKKKTAAAPHENPINCSLVIVDFFTSKN